MPDIEDLSENVVFVGDKELSKYVNAVLLQTREFEESKLKARGRKNIGKAIDIAEIARQNHEGVNLVEIETDTISFEDRNVSEIEITMTQDEEEQ